VGIYPGQACPPTAATAVRLQNLMVRTFGGQGWAPRWLFGGLGVLLGVRGAPRCLVTVGEAAGAMGWARCGGWGPREVTRVQQRTWETIAAAAIRKLEGGDGLLGARDAQTIAALEAERTGEGIRTGRRAGGAVYAACWATRYERFAIRWLGQRTAARRWLPSDGREWEIVRGRSFTQAFHVIRILAGGLRGQARSRPDNQRRQLRSTCTVCGTPDVAWTWVTPGPESQGLAWCATCLGAEQMRAGGAMWAVGLTGEEGGTFGTTAADSRDRLVAAGCRPLLEAGLSVGNGSPTRSTWGCCPLCGLGEGGGQHLVIWCPAVAAAWAALAPGCGSVAAPLERAEAPGRGAVGDLLQQASFLHTSLMGKATMTWPAARDWLLRAVRCMGEANRRAGPEEAASQMSDQEAAEEGEELGEAGTWSRLTGSCASTTCTGVPGGSLCRQRADRCGPVGNDVSPTERRAWVTATRSPVRAGARLVRLWCSQPRGHWPNRHPRWPAPRVVPAHRANAEWVVHRCDQCGRWACELRAQRHLAEGEIVMVPWSGHLVGLAGGTTAYEAAFDGASLRIRGIRCVGAGVAIWRRTGDGELRLIRRVWLALPEDTTALEAEAQACRLALQTVMAVGGGTRTVRMIGDNPIIISHGGHTRNTRDPVIADILDRTLAGVAQAGWSLRWSWVDRRDNRAANYIARVGAKQARVLHDVPGGPRQGQLACLI